MIDRWARGLGRAAAAIALVLIALSTACGSEASGPAGSGSPAPLPEVDVGSLPETIRDEVAAAQRAARAAPGDPAAAGELGMLYLVYDFPAAAASCFERSATLAPQDLKWHYYLGLAQQQAGDADRAIAAYERAIALDPRNVATLVRLGGLLLEKDPARAEALYKRAAEASPNNPKAHFGLGQCAKQDGRREEALRHFQDALDRAPDYAEAHYAMAMVLAAMGRRDEAQEHLRRHAAGQEPDPVDDPLYLDLTRKGRSSTQLRQDAARLAKLGQRDQAISLLQEAIRTDVTRTTARHQLGLLLAQQGRFQEAADQLRQVVEAEPGNVDAKATLGLALTELGRLDEAEKIYRDVLQRYPDHAPALVYLGEILSRAGRSQEALAYMRRGVEAQPGNGVYQYTLGDLLAREGEEKEAILHLGKAVQLMPKHAAARYTLGVLLARSGDVAGAKREWLAAVDANPNLAEPYGGLAAAALQENDPQAAVRWAEKACELSGYRSRAQLETLAEAYTAAGRKDDAEKIRKQLERKTEPGPRR